LVSVREINGWRKNVWAVSTQGIALEAILENESIGTYHGYPMGDGDPLMREVRKRWENE
jgi:hypothetical protein